MTKLILGETQLGLIQFDWTFVFQIVNTVLWLLIIYAIYTYFKKAKVKRKSLEERITALEREVEKSNEL